MGWWSRRERGEGLERGTKEGEERERKWRITAEKWGGRNDKG